MSTFIAIYGVVILVAMLVGGIVARMKRRDVSFWMTVAFLVPPAVLLLFLMPKHEGPRARRIGLDEQEQRELARDEHDRLF